MDIDDEQMYETRDQTPHPNSLPSACRQDLELSPVTRTRELSKEIELDRAEATSPADKDKLQTPVVDEKKEFELDKDTVMDNIVLFSEVLSGEPGRNNREFIELYNPGTETIDLHGWALWYLTKEDQEETLVHVWDERADIPGKGHFLLVHEGEDFDILPDGVYAASLFAGKGGLRLQNDNAVVTDRLG